MVLIREVQINKANGQKTVTIPKKNNIKAGDYVRIILVPINFESE